MLGSDVDQRLAFQLSTTVDRIYGKPSLLFNALTEQKWGSVINSVGSSWPSKCQLLVDSRIQHTIDGCVNLKINSSQLRGRLSQIKTEIGREGGREEDPHPLDNIKWEKYCDNGRDKCRHKTLRSKIQDPLYSHRNRKLMQNTEECSLLVAAARNVPPASSPPLCVSNASSFSHTWLTLSAILCWCSVGVWGGGGVSGKERGCRWWWEENLMVTRRKVKV